MVVVVVEAVVVPTAVAVLVLVVVLVVGVLPFRIVIPANHTQVDADLRLEGTQLALRFQPIVTTPTSSSYMPHSETCMHAAGLDHKQEQLLAEGL